MAYIPLRARMPRFGDERYEQYCHFVARGNTPYHAALAAGLIMRPGHIIAYGQNRSLRRRIDALAERYATRPALGIAPVGETYDETE